MTRHCEPSSQDEGEAIQGVKRKYPPWIAQLLILGFAPRNDEKE